MATLVESRDLTPDATNSRVYGNWLLTLSLEPSYYGLCYKLVCNGDTMDATSEQPLEIPAHTLVAFENARRAALRTRQTVEVSRAPLLAGFGLTAIGLGSFIIGIDSPLADWAKFAVAGPALLLSLGGNALVYYFLWTWLRQGRWGGPRSPFSDPFAPHSSRRRFGLFAIIVLFVSLESIGWHALKGRGPDSVYYGQMIWGSRLAIFGISAFFVHRSLRSGFWEYSVFAAGVAATGGLYIFIPHRQLSIVSPAPLLLALVSILTAIAAAASLHRRWHHWTLSNASADEIEDPASPERE
jgi:hypothetical protein